MKKEVYINGNIYGVNGSFARKEAMVIGDGKFLYFGGSKAAKKFVDSGSSLIDLKGKFVVPKFYDAHVHLIEGGLSLERLDLSNVHSEKEFQDKLFCYSKKNKDAWIIGMNWTENNFGGEVPDKRWIDKVIPNRPVILYRMDLHTALFNSKALELVGIDKNFIPPKGGKVELLNGEPTGIIKDAALFYANGFIPKLSVERKLSALKKGIEQARKFGLAGVHDMLFDIEDLDVYKKFCREEKLDDFQISISIPIGRVKEFIESELQLCENIKIIGAKGFADGSLGAKTAWFFKSYKDEPNNFGLPTKELKERTLLSNAILADKIGLQISIHAIGDRAVSEVLNLFEEVRKQNPDSVIAHRIEHAQHVSSFDLKRFKELNLIASMQPFHFFTDKHLITKYRGEEELKNSFPVKKFLYENIAVAFGTDFPVVGINPLQGIKLITGGYKSEIGEIDSIPPEDAIKCYVEEASKAIGQGRTNNFAIGERGEFVQFELG